MQAGIRYTAATGEKLVNETFGPNNIHRKTSGTEEWPDGGRDGRQGRFSLDENGFVFVEHKTAVRTSSTRPSSSESTTRRSPR